MAQKQRVKPRNLLTFDSQKEVDDALFEYAQMQIKIDKINAELEEKVNELKNKAAAEVTDLNVRMERISNSVKAYTEYHKDELFKKQKSKELVFGVLGYRKGRDTVRTKKTTVEKLEDMGLEEAIIVKKSPNKEVLITYTDEILRQADCKRVIGKDEFWFEPKREEVLKKLKQAS